MGRFGIDISDEIVTGRGVGLVVGAFVGISITGMGSIEIETCFGLEGGIGAGARTKAGAGAGIGIGLR